MDNAVLLNGFAITPPAVEAQMQTQVTNFAFRVRDQPTVPGKGLWKNPGSLFTTGTTTSPARTGRATLTLSTADLSNPTATVEGSAAQSVALSSATRIDDSHSSAERVSLRFLRSSQGD